MLIGESNPPAVKTSKGEVFPDRIDDGNEVYSRIEGTNTKALYAKYHFQTNEIISFRVVWMPKSGEKKKKDYEITENKKLVDRFHQARNFYLSRS